MDKDLVSFHDGLRVVQASPHASADGVSKSHGPVLDGLSHKGLVEL